MNCMIFTWHIYTTVQYFILPLTYSMRHFQDEEVDDDDDDTVSVALPLPLPLALRGRGLAR